MSGLIPWFRLEGIPIPLPEQVDIFGYRASFPQDWAIQPFGILVAIGVMLGATLSERRGKAVGLHPNAVASCVAHVLIGGFVVGHVFDVIAYHPETVFEDPLGLLRIWESLSSFGGFLGAVIGLVVYLRKYGVDGRVIGDPIAWSFPLGWMFGRTGCFVVHDHPGAPTDFFLGVRDYEVGSRPYVTRHDMGLYEILWAASVMGLFVYLGRTPRKRGFYLGLLPILYAPVRFGLDFLRATDLEQADARYFGLTPGHYGAIALFAAGIVFLRWVMTSPEPVVPASIAWDEATMSTEDATGKRTEATGAGPKDAGARSSEAEAADADVSEPKDASLAAGDNAIGAPPDEARSAGKKRGAKRKKS